MGCIMRFISPSLYTIILVTQIKKGFLKKKERAKGFFIFFSFYFIVLLFICYDLSKLNQTATRSSPANETVVRLLSFLIVRMLDTVNMVLLFFSIRTQNGCTRGTHKKKIFEGKNFWYFFCVFQEELASLVSTGKPFSGHLES